MPAGTATVRRQFDARAAAFPRHDAIVRESARRLFERLEVVRHEAGILLDVGCGAGACRDALLGRFPGASWIGVDLSTAMLAGDPSRRDWRRRLPWLGRPAPWQVCAEAGRLPLADGSCDLVFCNQLLPLHPDPAAVVRELARVLRAGGLLLVASLGPDTLRELRDVVARHLPLARAVPHVDMHDLGDMMVRAGFDAPVTECEPLRLLYPGARELLRETRALGGNPRDDRMAHLPPTRAARAILADLDRSKDGEGRIALTFELVFAHGWKVGPPPREEWQPVRLNRP